MGTILDTIIVGKREEIAGSLRALELGQDTVVIDGTAVQRAKPEPDLFVLDRYH